MVEIQPVDDDEELVQENSTRQNDNEKNNVEINQNNSNKTSDGWEKLMGEDLLMKVSDDPLVALVRSNDNC